MVSAELDVVAHHDLVHPNEFNGESVDNEFYLDVDCAVDDVEDTFFGKAVVQFGVCEACKVTM